MCDLREHQQRIGPGRDAHRLLIHAREPLPKRVAGHHEHAEREAVGDHLAAEAEHHDEHRNGNHGGDDRKQGPQAILAVPRGHVAQDQGFQDPVLEHQRRRSGVARVLEAGRGCVRAVIGLRSRADFGHESFAIVTERSRPRRSTMRGAPSPATSTREPSWSRTPGS